MGMSFASLTCLPFGSSGRSSIFNPPADAVGQVFNLFYLGL
jgi:hypothetical protein